MPETDKLCTQARTIEGIQKRPRYWADQMTKTQILGGTIYKKTQKVGGSIYKRPGQGGKLNKT